MTFSREARAQRDEHLERVFGTKDVPFAERGMLEVRLAETASDAFNAVMNYIYTDRIICKKQIFHNIVQIN